MHAFTVVPFLDVLAFVWFIAAWLGYQWFSAHWSKTRPSLLGETNQLRRAWMFRVGQRDARVVDAAITANLSNSPTFFASTTMIVIGGLFALLSRTELVKQVVSDIPFAAQSTELVWELKVLTLIGIFVYAFFRFTWSLRQFNFVAVVVGAAQLDTHYATHPEQHAADAQRAGTLVSLAAESFNDGLRGYYFAIAAIGWFFHPLLLMVAASLVVGILYNREYHSPALKALLATKSSAHDS